MSLPAKSIPAAGADPYSTSSMSLTLKNTLDIRDPIELNQCELVFSAFRRQQGLPNGDFNWEHLQAMHHHLFQDVYEWAGEARVTGLKSSDGFEYASPDRIEDMMKVVFSELAADHFLIGSSQEEFVGKAAYYYDRMNKIHPFRTGNGRTIRCFIEGLAANNGLQIDWKQIDREMWLEGSKSAAQGDRSKLKTCFSKVTQDLGFGAQTRTKPALNEAQSRSAGEQAIKILKKSIKSGKGLGASCSPDDLLDIPKSSSGPEMG